MTINLLDFDAADLTAFFAEHGEKPFRARQVLRWMHRFGQSDFDAMTDIAKSLREKLKVVASVTPPAIVSDKLSDDGTRKFLFDVGGGNAVETVFIPEDDRGTLCVSTQAGCALDCSFCSTGKQGFNRNLSVGEIIGQLWQANRALGADPAGDRIISNVVLMGMGEPLYNFDNVRDAMKVVMDGEGISLSRRRITLSTSGIVPEIAKTAEEIGCLLAVSFHATEDATGDRLVPVNKKWNIATLLDALRDYPKLSNSERITFEYVMLDGINDSDEDARRLVKLIRGIPAKINLIPFNEWPGAPYKRSSWERIEKFADIIYHAGYASPIRTPRGEDIMAACGQLKSETVRARNARRA